MVRITVPLSKAVQERFSFGRNCPAVRNEKGSRSNEEDACVRYRRSNGDGRNCGRGKVRDGTCAMRSRVPPRSALPSVSVASAASVLSRWMVVLPRMVFAALRLATGRDNARDRQAAGCRRAAGLRIDCRGPARRVDSRLLHGDSAGERHGRARLGARALRESAAQMVKQACTPNEWIWYNTANNWKGEYDVSSISRNGKEVRHVPLVERGARNRNTVQPAVLRQGQQFQFDLHGEEQRIVLGGKLLPPLGEVGKDLKRKGNKS